MAKRKSLSDLVKETAAQQPEPSATPEELAAAIGAQMKERPTSRPPKPKRLNVDLDPDFYDAVQQKALAQGKNLSQIVRELLEVYLKV